MYSLFFLLSSLAYIFWREKEKTGLYWLSIALFALSLACKPMGITLPAVLLTVDWLLFKDKLSLRGQLDKLPYIALAVLLTALSVTHTYSTVATVYYMPLWKSRLGAFHTLLFYVGKTVLPVNLSSYYPFWEFTGGGLPWTYVAAPFAVAGWLYFAWRLRARHPEVFAGSAWYGINVLPVLQWLPTGPALAADRYSYMASIGLCFIAAVWFEKLLALRRTIALATLGVVALILFDLTALRCYVWQDSVTLWSAVLEKYPGAEMALYRRADAYFRLGDLERAVADSTTLLTADRQSAEGFTVRGSAFLAAGLPDRAANDFSSAITLDGKNPGVYSARGTAYFMLRNYPAAQKDFSSAIALDASDRQAYNNRGLVFAAQGDYLSAEADFSRAIALAPSYSKAYVNRAAARDKLGKRTQAAGDRALAATLRTGE